MKRSNAWKGGSPPRPDGYIRVWCPDHPMANSDGYAMEHRVVVFDAGIEIPDGFHVHHINEDRADNRIENLEVVPASEHWLRHAGESGVIVNQHGEFPLGGDPERRRETLRRNREDRAARSHDAPHGTIGGYSNWKCRCEPCRAAYSEYRKAKRRQAAA